MTDASASRSARASVGDPTSVDTAFSAMAHCANGANGVTGASVVTASASALMGPRPFARERDYSTFCSISLTSEPRRTSEMLPKGQSATAAMFDASLNPLANSVQARREANNQSWRMFLLMVFAGGIFFPCGLIALLVALVKQFSVDQYLFLGAIVSLCFSLIVVTTFLWSKRTRAHPNPLIFSKSVIDFLLAVLYIFQYVVTEYSNAKITLSFRCAALTQALLVSGEFWFFAMPMDLLQSITNPFTSYSRNLRSYWFYSTLTGVMCGVLLWCLDDHDYLNEKEHTGGVKLEGTKEDGDVQRFIWFHHNTNMQGFFWHQWISYHVWVVIYLLFGAFAIVYVKRRLERGLEETFGVRKRVLSNAFFACIVYISWSFVILCLFAMSNSETFKKIIGDIHFVDLICISAFFHSARGMLNLIVWMVVNGSNLYTFFVLYNSRDPSACLLNEQAEEEKEMLMRPELNLALRRQVIQMATTGIVESVEQFHRLDTNLMANQSLHLDWGRSPKRNRLTSEELKPPSVFAAQDAPYTHANVHVVGHETHRFSFLQLSLSEMQFYDFQPRVFASIRHVYGIKDTEYIRAFRSTINERISEGRSGAFVFNSIDRKYLVKSMTSTEKTVLMEMLPLYLRYIKWNPQTLLPRFFGVHAMNMYGQTFYFVVMGNIFSNAQTIHRRYDIKGSWENRNAPACVWGERYRCSRCGRYFEFGKRESCDATGDDHDADIVLRDNDLKHSLSLHPDTADQLIKQLRRDSDFLCSMGIMDYSLLIGVHYSRFKIDQTRRNSLFDSPEAASTPQQQHQQQIRQLRGSQASCSMPLEEDDEEEEEVFEVDRLSRSDSNASSAALMSLGQQILTDNGDRPSFVLSDDGFRSNEIHTHRYRAHRVSGPSVYFLGVIDVLQKWTVPKQIERVYKVHVLRKDARGVSATAPRAYAARFQQRVRQLLNQNYA